MKRRMGADEAVLHIGAGAPAWLLRDLIERLPPEHRHTAAALALLKARGSEKGTHYAVAKAACHAYE